MEVRETGRPLAGWRTSGCRTKLKAARLQEFRGAGSAAGAAFGGGGDAGCGGGWTLGCGGGEAGGPCAGDGGCLRDGDMGCMPAARGVSKSARDGDAGCARAGGNTVGGTGAAYAPRMCTGRTASPRLGDGFSAATSRAAFTVASTARGGAPGSRGSSRSTEEEGDCDGAAGGRSRAVSDGDSGTADVHARRLRDDCAMPLLPVDDGPPDGGGLRTVTVSEGTPCGERTPVSYRAGNSPVIAENSASSSRLAPHVCAVSLWPRSAALSISAAGSRLGDAGERAVGLPSMRALGSTSAGSSPSAKLRRRGRAGSVSGYARTESGEVAAWSAGSGAEPGEPAAWWPAGERGRTAAAGPLPSTMSAGGSARLREVGGSPEAGVRGASMNDAPALSVEVPPTLLSAALLAARATAFAVRLRMSCMSSLGASEDMDSITRLPPSGGCRMMSPAASRVRLPRASCAACTCSRACIAEPITDASRTSAAGGSGMPTLRRRHPSRSPMLSAPSPPDDRCCSNSSTDANPNGPISTEGGLGCAAAAAAARGIPPASRGVRAGDPDTTDCGPAVEAEAELRVDSDASPSPSSGMATSTERDGDAARFGGGSARPWDAAATCCSIARVVCTLCAWCVRSIIALGCSGTHDRSDAPPRTTAPPPCSTNPHARLTETVANKHPYRLLMQLRHASHPPRHTPLMRHRATYLHEYRTRPNASSVICPLRTNFD